ncbi:SDR family NAD(P)-dependent oxidoreductase [Butyrivibrio sp. XPD2002]|uniref:SDR family NAD(P)-dependent oxidoreductase n=1 Tax=Butyrivibrio sp. XPD2002 TaxID=1280665 RepID=UPI000406A03A|nr:SDR family oxidoreductase [Butyrivibrio sp. XPD2002]
MGILLEGKVCLVTGANRGIGKSIVEQFAKEGAIVYANARSEGSIDVSAYSEYKDNIIPVYFDIRDNKLTGEVFAKIWKEHGKLDVLVNNAGIVQDAFVGMIKREMVIPVFETNVFSMIDLIQYAAKVMKRNKRGSIINISSVVGIYGNEGQMVYSASKGAVISSTRSAAKELAPYNIRVNAVAPGMIETDMLKAIDNEKKEKYLSRIATGRFGTPVDIANICVMLASNYTEYMTGQVLEVSGGLSL